MRSTKWSVVLSALALGTLTACSGGGSSKAASTPASQPAASQPAASQPAASQPAASGSQAAQAAGSTATAAAAGQHPGWPKIGELPKGATMAEAQEGEQIFHSSGNCYTCHGVDAKGTALAPNLTDSAWININGSYAEIMHTDSLGIPKPKAHPAPMPPMGGGQLTAQQIHDVAAYVYSISRKKTGG